MALNTVKVGYVLFPRNVTYLKARADREQLAVSQLLRNILSNLEQEDYGRQENQPQTTAGNASKSKA